MRRNFDGPSAVQRSAVQCSAVQRSAVQCSAVQCSAVCNQSWKCYLEGLLQANGPGRPEGGKRLVLSPTPHS